MKAAPKGIDPVVSGHVHLFELLSFDHDPPPALVAGQGGHRPGQSDRSVPEWSSVRPRHGRRRHKRTPVWIYDTDSRGGRLESRAKGSSRPHAGGLRHSWPRDVVPANRALKVPDTNVCATAKTQARCLCYGGHIMNWNERYS